MVCKKFQLFLWENKTWPNQNKTKRIHLYDISTIAPVSPNNSRIRPNANPTSAVTKPKRRKAQPTTAPLSK